MKVLKIVELGYSRHNQFSIGELGVQVFGRLAVLLSQHVCVQDASTVVTRDKICATGEVARVCFS